MAERQSSTLPPAQPSYIFRGHASQIHSVRIAHQNSRLITGDADGWLVFWRLESKRPLAVWKAHDAAILGTAEWGPERIITHGRDNTLRIWQVRPGDETSLSTVLPAEQKAVHRPKPWLLHSLPVNTLNFCSFSMCHQQPIFRAQRNDTIGMGPSHPTWTGIGDSILVAVPARDDKKIEVYQFPDEKLKSVVPRVQSTDTGMVMAVKLTHHQTSNNVIVIAGYEGGFTAVYLLGRNFRPNSGSEDIGQSVPNLAQIVYLSQPHTQPILSLDATPDAKTYFTSSADAVIATHQIPELPLNEDDRETAPTTTEGMGLATTTLASPVSNATSQDSSDPPALTNRPEPGTTRANVAREVTTLVDNNDSPVAAVVLRSATKSSASMTTSAYSDITSKQDADNGIGDLETADPLDFSKKPMALPTPTSSLSFSKQPMPPESSPNSASTNSKRSGLSTLLSAAPSQAQDLSPPSMNLPVTVAVQPPYKAIQTKHAGQQSLRIRPDGRLLVTGGWDSRVRIYSTRTLKEIAILKWHKVGVYAVDFGEVLDVEDLKEDSYVKSVHDREGEGAVADNKLVRQQHGLGRLQRQREEQIQLKHWVAAGSKDGKVSLWEVF